MIPASQANLCTTTQTRANACTSHSPSWQLEHPSAFINCLQPQSRSQVHNSGAHSPVLGTRPGACVHQVVVCTTQQQQELCIMHPQAQCLTAEQSKSPVNYGMCQTHLAGAFTKWLATAPLVLYMACWQVLHEYTVASPINPSVSGILKQASSVPVPVPVSCP